MSLAHPSSQPPVSGRFVDLHGERYYKIANVDHMAPFFISVVSASDHWLFISSTGSLTAGRIRPENALFPYKSVDYIHESAENTGSKTLVRVTTTTGSALWEPFNRHHDGLYQVERNLYKNTIGDKLVFEEINHSLQLSFQYSWNTSERFGFVRHAEIRNLSDSSQSVELIDGLQNLQPSGAPLGSMQKASALVDAYKWNERLADSPLVLYTMYAKLTDRAEPAESLLATSVFSLDSGDNQLLLSSKQLQAFRRGLALEEESLVRGERGAYLLAKTIDLAAQQSADWRIVADIDHNHQAITQLQQLLSDPAALQAQVSASIAANQQELINLMSGGDAWQLTNDEATSVHHYANVLFNSMRGGVFDNGYLLDKQDVLSAITNTNAEVATRQQQLLAKLPEKLLHSELLAAAKQSGDAQLIRICYEYLPLTFGRRHGDPSRPWNHFEIKLKDEQGERLLSYQGNWRDIFQNWEAMAASYPGFVGSFLAKFVNASTMDGYNPYRITKEGIDWELLDENDPWSNIGYWGDHQIIYLLKFLEQLSKYNSGELSEMLSSDIFSYANVPYRLGDVDKLFANPKDTVEFDSALQQTIEQRVDALGFDGRMVLDGEQQVYMVNLMEKVLVPLLAKLSNLVLDGGIWLNTQRPEWNDANNAIVGNGLSMVTLYYMRRYVAFMQTLLQRLPESTRLSSEVVEWMLSISHTLEQAQQAISQAHVTPQLRKSLLTELELAAERYRNKVYQQNGFTGKQSVEIATLKQFADVALAVLDASIRSNLRSDGLYNAYNIMTYSAEQLSIEQLYPMLEGQVAILSAGVLSPEQAVALLDKLFASEMYRPDQQSFMLYPDRALNGFMDKNRLSAASVGCSTLLSSMLEANDTRIIQRDEQGNYRFHASCENIGQLRAAITQVKPDYASFNEEHWQNLEAAYEETFNHKAFTGRSGTMFGYEGLGCIYWHMVSKLLLAVQENYLAAREADPQGAATQQLADYYYRVRQGIGFNKTPDNYGAFPTDPYSHTPKQAGAQQPGMTGQVKEEVLTRFGELGLEIIDGCLSIKPSLLKRDEFLQAPAPFRYQDLQGESHSVGLDQAQLAFTYCQVPFIYQLDDSQAPGIRCELSNGQTEQISGLTLPASFTAQLFQRSGEIAKLSVTLSSVSLRSA